MTDFFYTQTAAELQVNHDKVSATTGALIDENNLDSESSSLGFIKSSDLPSFQVSPLTTFNGFFRSGMVLAQGVQLPSSNDFAAGEDIVFDWFAGTSGCLGVTITDAGISWSTSDPNYSIVTTVDLGAGTEITLPDQLTAYVIGDDEVKHYIKDGENSVSISVAGGVATFEFKSGIFASLGITTIKQAFGLFQVGVVENLNEDETEREVRGGYIFRTNANGNAKIWADNSCEQYGVITSIAGASGSQDFPFPMETDYELQLTTSSTSGGGATSVREDNFSSRDGISFDFTGYVGGTGSSPENLNFSAKGRLA